MVVVASPRLGLPVRRRHDWRQLLPLPWILPAPGVRLRRVVDRMFERQGLQPPSPAIEGSSLQGSVSLSLAGLGVTVAPPALIEQHLRSGALREVNIVEQLPTSSLTLVYRRVSAGYLEGVTALRRAVQEAFA